MIIKLTNYEYTMEYRGISELLMRVVEWQLIEDI